MRLEYTEEQEAKLRIAAIESVLENDLYEDKLEEYILIVEKQFLEGNDTAYLGPIKGESGTDIFIEITLETKDNEEFFSMTVLDENDKILSSNHTSKNTCELLELVLNEDK